jgi:hypothetical protein
MSEDNQLCPICKKGRMRPTGKAGTEKETEPPFAERGEARGYRCDNDDCKHYEFRTQITENKSVGESLSREVGKADQKGSDS